MRTPSFSFYNTLTRSVEVFQPLKKKRVGLYTCGPTVYNYAHLGNFRSFLFEDVLERALQYGGYTVHRVMNITDVGHLTGDTDAGEDKVDKEARLSRKSVKDIVAFYTKAFVTDAKKLNIKIPKILAPASKYIPEQIALIERLIKSGMAYETPTAIYFDVSKYPDYGKLSGQSLSDKMTGARDDVVTDSEKRNAADFALWFKLVGKFEHHLLRWPSPWGVGFPGWHIECSAIATKFLGQPFDIHTGGVDHIGTHHTNEIAQSEGAYGRPLARYWMHGEFFLVDSAKMAKSVGNFLTLKDVVEKGVHPLVFRYLVLMSHYRSPLNFSWVALDQAKNGFANLIGKLLLIDYHARSQKKSAKPSPALAVYEERFMSALTSDLNTAQALAVLHDMVKDKTLLEQDAKGMIALIYRFDDILGLSLKRQVSATAMPVIMKNKVVAKLLADRQKYRALQQFIQADRLRKKIDSLGYVLEDTTHGPFLSPKQIRISG